MTEKIEKSKYVTFPEVKEMFSNVNSEEADQIQRRTIDYVSKFSKISKDDALLLKEKLVKETKINEKEAVEIINIMPKSREELRVFTSGWKKLLPEEVLDSILSILGSCKRIID